MPYTTCNHCGASCYISEKDRDEGAEVYCSEECASAKAGDPIPPRPADDDRETVEEGDARYYRGDGADR